MIRSISIAISYIRQVVWWNARRGGENANVSFALAARG